jgi:hypothetical protein
MDSGQKRNIINAFLIGIFVICISWLFMSVQSNKVLQNNLNKEKLTNEALLSEKLETQKELEKTTHRITSLETKNSKLDELVHKKIVALSSIESERNALAANIKDLENRQNIELELKQELQERLTTNTEKYSKAESVNKHLIDSLKFLEAQNKLLRKELTQEVLKSIDQTLVTALKKNNNRITSKARAAKFLIAQVKVPSELENMSFTVEGPEGSNFTEEHNAITFRVLDNESKRITASLQNSPVADVHSKTLEIKYTPKEKLQPGVYTLRIFNNHQYVGSMQTNLR